MGIREMITNAFFSAFFVLHLAITSAAAQGKSTPFMTSDVDRVAGKSFDYIIIGGGTSGCPLAATLSQKYSVLVVERGGIPYGNPKIEQIVNFGQSWLEADEFASVAQGFVSEDGYSSFRGRVLGGTTTINAGFYSRASKDFIKKMGWDEELVEDSYEWVESKVVFKPVPLKPFQSALKNAFSEVGILPFNGFSLEHIEGSKVGASMFDHRGKRHSAADLLMAGNPTRITILLNATVHNILFHPHDNEGEEKKQPIARGIRFSNSYSNIGSVFEAYLTVKEPKYSKSKGDVILSAGALGSPQLLMLSGIGPEEHLRDFNISTLINARGVGSGMQDNPSLRIPLRSSDPSSTRRPSEPGQVVAITDNFRIVVQGGALPISSNSTALQISSKFAQPQSKGYLKLNSTDPRRNPSVKFNLLATQSDLQGCVTIGHMLERLAFTESISKYLGARQRGFVGNGSSTDEELKEFCKSNAVINAHYHGGCQVGVVVDEDYAVYGVEGLRVVDGSTLSESPGTNPMATLLMLGRYQGIKILRERQDGED